MPTFKKSSDVLLIHSAGARGIKSSVSNKQSGARGPKTKPQQPPKR